MKSASKPRIGKLIGGNLYVHRNYALDALRDWSPGSIDLVLRDHRWLSDHHPEFVSQYTIIKIDPGKSYVSFISSPDFDTASEPIVGDAYLVREDGSTRFIPQAKDPWVYHGKHLMVGPDYKGFSRADEVEWFDFWNKNLKIPHSRIGKKSVWGKVKPQRQTDSMMLVGRR